MNKLLLICCSFICVWHLLENNGAIAEKILFTFFHDTGSHFQSMLPMMEKFASRGHSVYILDTMLPVDKQKPFLHHIRAPLPIYPSNAQEKAEMGVLMWSFRLIQPTFAYVYHVANKDFGILMSNYSEQIVDIVNTDWDLVVVDDIFWSFGFALSTLRQRVWDHHWHKGNNNGTAAGTRKGPPHFLVYATSGTSVTVHNSIRATGRSWVERPQICTFIPQNEDDAFTTARFSHRVYNFLEVFMEFISVNIIVERFLMPNIEKFGVPKFNWHEFLSGAKLFFYENIDRMGMPLAVGPEMITTGVHCEKSKKETKLPNEFLTFMDRPNSNGVLYVAFGTHVNWQYAPEHILTALLNTFDRLTNYQIIFACKGCEKEKKHNMSKNVLIVDWAPQHQILKHPNTKAFLTHGGHKSVLEGICAGVPIIVMPVMAEQPHNAHVLLKTRIASAVINKFYFTEENLYNTINEVLFRSNELLARAKKVREIFEDRPMPAMDEGVFAVEHRLFDDNYSHAWTRYTQRKGMRLGWAKFAHFELIYAIFFATILMSW